MDQDEQEQRAARSAASSDQSRIHESERLSGISRSSGDAASETESVARRNSRTDEMRDSRQDVDDAYGEVY
ncbi:MAG: hypothetical protein ABJA80_13780 [bacterium]